MRQPTYLEFDLAFLISGCGVTHGAAIRRLNGIENTVTALARRWRAPAPVLAADELRMSNETLQRLIAWVTAETPRSEALDARLAPYTTGAVLDASVPAGWIRLCLKTPPPSASGGG